MISRTKMGAMTSRSLRILQYATKYCLSIQTAINEQMHIPMKTYTYSIMGNFNTVHTKFIDNFSNSPYYYKRYILTYKYIEKRWRP